ncbi:MAG: MFS transporter [Acetobacteraceae bacterium]|nr:MFS transporter [Acetobacteraceae bacterium]
MSAPVRLMAVGGFATGAGMRLLDPLLPLVAAGFATSVSSAAILIAAFMLPYGAGQLLTGPLGDRLGKLRVASVALGLYGIVTAAAVFASTLGEMTTLRVLAGALGGAVIPLMIAHVGDKVPYEERQAALGRFATGMVMAQLVAGPLSGVIGEHFGWRASFLVLGLFACGVGAFLFHRIGRGDRGTSTGKGLGLSGYATLLRRPAGRSLMLLAFFDGFFLFGGAFPFVGSLVIERFGLSAGEAGLLVALFGLGAFTYTRIAKQLVRRFGEAGLMRWGGGSLAVLLLLTAASPDWHLTALAQAFAGLAFYMFHGVLQARATEALPEARGTAVSAFALALFLGQTAGALVFALILAAAGYAWVFGLAAAGMAALTVWAARRR